MGPIRRKKTKTRLVNPLKKEPAALPYGKYFITGNYLDSFTGTYCQQLAGVLPWMAALLLVIRL